MNALFELQNQLFHDFMDLPFYPRESYQHLTLDNAATGIVGPRGIGKTTLLMQKALEWGALEHRALYVSVDHIHFDSLNLFDLADRLYKETDVRLLCIDEIHKYPNWQQHIKSIVDSFRKLKILFTGSSAIDIVHGKYDLSRRVTLVPLHGLSFREYCGFTLDTQLPKATLTDVITHPLDILKHITLSQPLKHFSVYLQQGYYPFNSQFRRNQERYQAIVHANQKTLYEDIATLHTLKTPTLVLMEKLYHYICTATPGELNINKLANAIQKDFKNTQHYLHLLAQSGLIRCLYQETGNQAPLRHPKKLYPDNTNVIYALDRLAQPDNIIGKVRETFALNQLQNAGHQVSTSPQGDFLVDQHWVLKIGGKNKTTTQLCGIKNGVVFADGILTSSKNILPLFLLGCLT